MSSDLERIDSTLPTICQTVGNYLSDELENVKIALIVKGFFESECQNYALVSDSFKDCFILSPEMSRSCQLSVHAALIGITSSCFGRNFFRDLVKESREKNLPLVLNEGHSHKESSSSDDCGSSAALAHGPFGYFVRINFCQKVEKSYFKDGRDVWFSEGVTPSRKLVHELHHASQILDRRLDVLSSKKLGSWWTNEAERETIDFTNRFDKSNPLTRIAHAGTPSSFPSKKEEFLAYLELGIDGSARVLLSEYVKRVKEKMALNSLYKKELAALKNTKNEKLALPGANKKQIKQEFDRNKDAIRRRLIQQQAPLKKLFDLSVVADDEILLRAISLAKPNVGKKIADTILEKRQVIALSTVAALKSLRDPRGEKLDRYIFLWQRENLNEEQFLKVRHQLKSL